jgi:hypothetical protein
MVYNASKTDLKNKGNIWIIRSYNTYAKNKAVMDYRF